MTDIVERLRFDSVRCETQFSKGVAGNIEEAAVEIERLRAAMATASVRLHGLAKMDHFSHGAVNEVADYLAHEQCASGKEPT